MIQRLLGSLRNQFRIPLFANAYALMTNQVLAAGVGFLYWLIAARLYPDEVVGINAAIISTIIFMATLAELSFKSAMIRFVPRAGKGTARLIAIAFIINISIAFLVSLFLVTVGRSIPLTSSLLENVNIAPWLLIVATVAWSNFYIQDGVMIGMRHSKWVLVKTTLFSITKLALLVAFFKVFAEYGLVASWFITVPVFILVFSYMIFVRFMPQHIKGDISGTRPITRGELFRSIGGDHIGTLLAETTTRLMPLLVLHLLSESFTAYYYQAWNIASTLYLLATSMTNSFMVEASANMTQLALNSRRIMRQMTLLLIPAVLVLWVAAPWILQLFGATYARESINLLRWLALATLPYMFTTWFLSYARILAKVRIIIMVQALQLIITMTISYFFIPVYGIVSIGVAWFLAHSVIACLAAIRLVQLFLARRAEHADEKVSQVQLLRRADWRFLLPDGGFQKSLCFNSGPLRDALATFSARVTDPTDMDRDHDLAVASDPTLDKLKQAHAALKPGGVLYTEWTGWRRGGLGRIRQLVTRAGFSVARAYAPLPGPERPRLWICLQGSKAPFQYIARQMLPGSGLVARLGRFAIARLVAPFVQLGLVPHLSLVARKEPASTPDLLDLVTHHWEPARPGSPPDPLSFLILTSGSLLSNNIVCLAFSGNETFPGRVVKLPRMQRDAVTLEHEREVLADLQEFGDGRHPQMRIPRFFLPPFSDQLRTYGQSALRGMPVGKLLDEHTFPSFAARLTDAQIALARHSREVLKQVENNRQADWLLQGLEGFQELSMSAEELARTQAVLEKLACLPSTYVHNDFAVWNMVDTPEGLGVFDWSDADRRGLPLLDLVYGLAGAVFQMENAHTAVERRSSYLRLLNAASPNGRLFRECLERYARETGLPAESIPALRLVTWVLHSTYERSNHQLELVESEGTYVSLCTPLWKAELQFQVTAPLPGGEGSKE